MPVGAECSPWATVLVWCQGKSQVAMAMASFIIWSAINGKMISSLFLYDDNCHFLLRILSIMGLGWEFATLAICDFPMEKLHFSNHIARWCVSQLNPYKRPLLTHGKTNSPVCEQRFRCVARLHS
jgi:hypothetical protein